MNRQKTVLRRLRREREITLVELANATGINAATLSLGERALQKLSPEQQEILAKYFGVPKEQLLAEASAS